MPSQDGSPTEENGVRPQRPVSRTPYGTEEASFFAGLLCIAGASPPGDEIIGADPEGARIRVQSRLWQGGRHLDPS